MDLVANNLSYKPDDQYHLNEVSFNFKEGNLYTILGRTLSGKTTLLKTIAGLLTPDSGEIEFDGKNFLKVPVWERNVAMVYQQFINYPHLNVFENIAFPLKQRKIDRSIINDKVMDALKSVGLLGYEKRKIQELSGGQQQRVAVAMALAGKPDLLLLDEPTTGLDVTTQAHVLELLRFIAKDTGTSMIYVSHDLGAIAQVSDRIVVMYAGEIVLEGPARKILKEPIHPYTYGLLKSIPKLSLAGLPASMPGSQPQPGSINEGCSFYDRCNLATDNCKKNSPDLEHIKELDTNVRCINYKELINQNNNLQTSKIGRAHV